MPMDVGNSNFSGACAPDEPQQQPAPALELLPWLEPLAVSYVDDGRVARVTVQAALRRGARPPKQVELRAGRGKLISRYGVDRLKLEREGSGTSGRARSTLSFTSTFSLPP